jgi:hypothetical protein
MVRIVKGFALIKNGTVENTALATQEFADEVFKAEYDAVIEFDREAPGGPSKGWGWNGKKFIPAESV